ncbi:hypothetical protein [Bdellovibrio sp. KM01]|uniref:hypothetical protein n=1 Tax=Bdellovibrio sp. KM01 TaxID=2748865 RepID=UPI0015EAA2A0|nr:hypothetical protein [Bdellovibrio sp. KM01]QLY25699.1 hypothetical protein HW988_01200 [Bdellovibrio sp. KM01]
MKVKKPKTQMIERLKERALLAEKANITFRVSTDISRKFKAKCKKDGFSAGMVIEELMRDYAEMTSKAENE